MQGKAGAEIVKDYLPPHCLAYEQTASLAYFFWQNKGWKWTILLLKYAKINTKEGKGICQQKDTAKKSNKYKLGEQIYFENHRMLSTIRPPRLWNNLPINVGKENWFVNATRLLQGVLPWVNDLFSTSVRLDLKTQPQIYIIIFLSFGGHLW